MSSCIMKNQDSDEEVDLEALRLAALKSRKPKYPCVNHNNLIPIVPVAVESKDFVGTKIKLEKVSPPREDDFEGVIKADKENDEEKDSNCSKISLENDQDILSMDDKEEEDSLERLMDQLEAEISGKAPVPANRTVLSSKASPGVKKENKGSRKNDKEGDDEVELVQVKTGKEPSAIIEIRESASPESVSKETRLRKSISPKSLRDINRRSASKMRSRSPFSRERSYRRSRSPYWSRSPRRYRSPFRRSRSSYRLGRKSRSKSRTPFGRRYRSPPRKRSPFSRSSRSRSPFSRSSRSRSPSYGRSPWSISPRRRSESPFYRDGSPPRHRAFNSPRRSFSPRQRYRSPRPFAKLPPYHRSKSPFRRSRSPFRKSSIRRSESPILHRSKSPFNKLNSPNRSPVGKKLSKSAPRRYLPKSVEKSPPRHRSKSPGRKYEAFRSPGRSKEGRSVSISMSPTPRRNRSPLKVVEKNKLEGEEKNEKLGDRNRSERRHRSLSRENNRTHDRRPNRQKYPRRFSPSRNRRSSDRLGRKSKSSKRTDTFEKSKEEVTKPKEKEATPPAAPLDPVLEARKKKFENLGEVDPTVDKKINLKPIKESAENPEDDEDVLTLNVDCSLWDESEESEDEFESRFKSESARKNRPEASSRTVLSFRNLREGDTANQKVNLSKPLIDDSNRDKFKRDRSDPWLHGRGSDRNERRRNPRLGETNVRKDEKESSRGKPSDKGSSAWSEKRSGRRPIVWSSKNERKPETNAKGGEELEKQSEVKENKSKFSERTFFEGREKSRREDSDKHETDDFEKLISDFEKELESDLCLTAKVSSTVTTTKSDPKRSKISLKKDFPDSKAEPLVKKPLSRIVKISEATLNKIEKSSESNNANDLTEEKKKVEVNESQRVNDGPEDYIEDDDFVLEVSASRKQKSKGEEEDNQSDLRAVLSRRRNERLTKAVSLQENMPTRLVQSAFQGLGNKKSNRQIREVQEATELPLSEKSTGAEGRRVLLLHREKNPITSIKCTVPEVKPDTTVHQRFTRSSTRRKRKLHRQLESMEDLEQEEEEQDGLEVEEEKQFRRFRLKRNVTLSSQRTQQRHFKKACDGADKLQLTSLFTQNPN